MSNLNKFEAFFQSLVLIPDSRIQAEYVCILKRISVLPTPSSIAREMRLLGIDIGIQHPTHASVDYPLIIKSFQQTFCPENVTGVLDIETVAILYAVVDAVQRTKNTK